MGATARDIDPALDPALDLTAAALLDHRDRHLPVIGALAELLPEAGLVRGRTVACTGGAAVSLALAVTAGATQAGSWLVVVGVPWVGVEAARELGVVLERTVSVAADPGDPTAWAERVAAAVDGFELIITSVPPRVPDRLLRQIRQRLQARGGVLVDVPGGRGPAPTADVVLSSAVGQWEGIGQGSGHLRCRRIDVTVAGRRVPRPVRAACLLPGPAGGLELVPR